MIGYITREQLDMIRAADSGFNYDVAMPQGLYDAITRVTGRNPCGHIVTAYPQGSIFGGLQAVTADGANMLKEWLAYNGNAD